MSHWIPLPWKPALNTCQSLVWRWLRFFNHIFKPATLLLIFPSSSSKKRQFCYIVFICISSYSFHLYNVNCILLWLSDTVVKFWQRFKGPKITQRTNIFSSLSLVLIFQIIRMGTFWDQFFKSQRSNFWIEGWEKINTKR